MSAADLRPLSLGELLDRTFTLYRNHFWLFVGIMALPQILVTTVALTLQALGNRLPTIRPGADPAQAAAQMGRYMSGLFIGIGTTLLVYWFIYSLAWGATTVAVSDVYLGRTANIRSAYRVVRTRFWGLIDVVFSVMLRVFGLYLVTIMAFALLIGATGTSIRQNPVLVALLMILLFFGMIASFVLVIWMGLRYAVAIPALLLEEIKARQAMKRSALLTRGHRGRIFLAFFLMILITYTIGLLFQAPFLAAFFAKSLKAEAIPFWLAALTVLSGGIGQVLSGPLLMISLALLYYDVRVRKEAFDLQVLMAALEPATPSTPRTAVPPAVT